MTLIVKPKSNLRSGVITWMSCLSAIKEHLLLSDSTEMESAPILPIEKRNSKTFIYIKNGGFINTLENKN